MESIDNKVEECKTKNNTGYRLRTTTFDAKHTQVIFPAEFFASNDLYKSIEAFTKSFQEFSIAYLKTKGFDAYFTASEKNDSKSHFAYDLLIGNEKINTFTIGRFWNPDLDNTDYYEMEILAKYTHRSIIKENLTRELIAKFGDYIKSQYQQRRDSLVKHIDEICSPNEIKSLLGNAIYAGSN
ncbi:MAG: hypothetical protein ACMXYG_06590 [Candidatus Woesearchaeota archaeon]